MIKEMIDRRLKKKLQEKQQEVIRLRWIKADMEKHLAELKQNALGKSFDKS